METSPVSNVTLQFNFLLYDSESKEQKHHSIEINLKSSLAEYAKDKDKMPRFFRYNFLNQRTARLEIKHQNYDIARTVIAAIDEWFSSHKKCEQNEFGEWLQNNLYYVRSFIAAALMSLLAYFYYEQVRALDFIDENFMRLTVGAVVLGFWISGIVSYYVSEKLQDFVFEITRNFSVIELNNGDRKLLTTHSTSKIKASYSAIKSLGAATLASVIANYIMLQLAK